MGTRAKSNVVPTNRSPGIQVLMTRTATSTLSVPTPGHRGLTDEGWLDLCPQSSWEIIHCCFVLIVFCIGFRGPYASPCPRVHGLEGSAMTILCELPVTCHSIISDSGSRLVREEESHSSRLGAGLAGEGDPHTSLGPASIWVYCALGSRVKQPITLLVRGKLCLRPQA